MQPQSYTPFVYPRLNEWFQPAYESLIASANRKSGWDAFDEDAPTQDPMPKQYAKVYCGVAALIRVCAAWKATRDQIADQLLHPFSLTVIETGDSAWVEATENLFNDGLIPAICETNPDAKNPNVVCCKSRWRKTTPLVLLLQLFQTNQLRPLHPTILLPPSIECLLRHADLAHRIGNRRPLPLPNLTLPKLRYTLFGLLSFSSHR